MGDAGSILCIGLFTVLLARETLQACPNSGNINGNIPGTINSPNYPSNYPANEKCAWRIQAPTGMIVRLQFDTIDLDCSSSCGCDYIQIYDGSTETVANVTRICTKKRDLFFSSGEYLYVVFTSDSKTSLHKGLTASYRAVAINMGCPPFGVIRSTSGFITSPDYPAKYPNSLTCTWNIIAPPPKQRFIFKCGPFELQDSRLYEKCDQDSVKLGTTKQLTITFCGNKIEGMTFKVSSNSAIMKFSSDDSQNYKGFNITYYTVPYDTAACPRNGNMNGTSGVIQSPGYPLSFPSYSDCVWTISVPQGYRIKLYFTVFNLTDISFYRCRRDEVGVFDGPSPNVLDYVGWFCGTKLMNARLYSSREQMTVTFTSDENGDNYSGFQASFVAEKVPSCPPVMRLSRFAGVITSPSYPSNYPRAFRCSWTIMRPSRNYKFFFHFHEFKLDFHKRCRDVVRFRRKSDNGYIKHFCLPTFPAKSFTFNDDDDVVVTFVAKSQLRESTEKGFKMTYTLIEIPPTTPPPKSWCPQATQILTSSQGSIDTYNPGTGYPPNMECTWLIKNPTLHTLAFKFTVMDLESSSTCQYDYVEVRDGQGPSSTLIGRYCGYKASGWKDSTSGYLWVRFSSDSSSQYRGFVMHYNSTGKASNGTDPRVTMVTTSTSSPGPAYSEAADDGSEPTFDLTTGFIIGAVVLVVFIVFICLCRHLRGRSYAARGITRNAGASTRNPIELHPLNRNTADVPTAPTTVGSTLTPSAPNMDSATHPGYATSNLREPGSQYERAPILATAFDPPPSYEECLNYPYPLVQGTPKGDRYPVNV